MARRKNVKRIDPRYFLHETVNRGDDVSVLEEANDPTHWIAQGEGLVDIHGEVLAKRGESFAAIWAPAGGGRKYLWIIKSHGTGQQRQFDRLVDPQELKNHQPNPNYRPPQQDFTNVQPDESPSWE